MFSQWFLLFCQNRKLASRDSENPNGFLMILEADVRKCLEMTLNMTGFIRDLLRFAGVAESSIPNGFHDL